MPAHMGNKQVTVQNLKIAKIDLEKNLALIIGAVPGHDEGYVIVRQAVKKLRKKNAA
jgi:large subunit ribosomal protein L3